MNERAEKILDILKDEFPTAGCELNYDSDYHLLIAVILSAQCTDKRVNIVTEELFKHYSSPQDFASAKQEDIEKLIYSCGFYKNKAKNIINASREIVEVHGGQVPKEFDKLVALSGVGRKTANVVTSVAFGGDGIAVDTHVFRVSNRLSLAKGKTPFEVEKGLTEVIPPSRRSEAHHLLIFHGRYRCKSLSPLCDGCKLIKYCSYDKKEKK